MVRARGECFADALPFRRSARADCGDGQPWITPSVFQATGKDSIIDEYTYGQQQDFDVALAALKAHWATWIVEDDFEAMSNAGLNHVRYVETSRAADGR